MNKQKKGFFVDLDPKLITMLHDFHVNTGVKKTDIIHSALTLYLTDKIDELYLMVNKGHNPS